MMYGKGVYFASNSQYSVGYAKRDDNDNGYQYMFLCRVILGESCIGRSGYTAPPRKPNSSIRYESMVDQLEYPEIFVISKDNQGTKYLYIYYETMHSIYRINKR